jgi:DNA (cytosine-5)-methyltransferase 1
MSPGEGRAPRSRHGAVRRPVAVDLFCGAGGLSLGFEQAGFDVVAGVEYDAVHAAVHMFNFPRCVVICADAATVTARAVRDAARVGSALHGRDWDGDIDVVIGGPPCQGFSTGGKRAFDDPRNQLVREYARLVGGLRPRYFVMENVPGIASVVAGEAANAPRLIELLVEELESFGYQVLPPRALNACHFGVPQDRQRVILVGSRNGETPARLPSAITNGRPRSGALSTDGAAGSRALPLCPSVRDAIGDLPNVDDLDELCRSDEARLSAADVAKGAERASHYGQIMRGVVVDPADLSWPRRWDPQLLTSSLRTRHDSATVQRFTDTDPGERERVSRFFRLHHDGVCSTLRAGTGYERGSFNAPRPIHPDHPRVVSVREAARLHSYPDWFRFHSTKWHGFRQVGNSLPPLVGRAVGAEVARALNVRPPKPNDALEPGDRGLLYMGTNAAAARMQADLSRSPRHALRRRKQSSRSEKPGSTNASDHAGHSVTPGRDA